MFRRQMRDTCVTLFITALLAGGCTKPDAAKPGPEEMSDSGGMTVGVGKPVPATAETPPVGADSKDAADDPEIWVDPKNPARGVIIGTDKKAGLYVYDLSGKQLQYLPGGMPNNVDLRGG